MVAPRKPKDSTQEIAASSHVSGDVIGKGQVPLLRRVKAAASVARVVAVTMRARRKMTMVEEWRAVGWGGGGEGNVY